MSYNMNDDSDWLKKIRTVPILDYAEKLGLQPRMLGNKYAGLGKGGEKDPYNSVRIDVEKNCFYRNSNGHSGGIIDFALEFTNCGSAKEAMHEIANMYGISKDNFTKPTFTPHAYVPKSQSDEVAKPKKVEYPQRAESMKQAWHYLVDERKIDKSVVEYFRKRGMLYQDTHNNCVFATKEYACMRSTGDKKFVADAKGCNYQEGFFFHGKTEDKPIKQMFVAESVIDIMSVMSYRAMRGQQYSESSAYLALGGTQKTESVFCQLKKNPSINTVYLCLDNDESGVSATNGIIDKIKKDFPNVKAVTAYAPNGKDWNEYIVKVVSQLEEKKEQRTESNPMNMKDVQKKIADEKNNNPKPVESKRINNDRGVAR